MRKLYVGLLALVFISPAVAQTPAPATPPVATDVTAADVQTFIDALPRDAVSDRPIRTVEVTGDYRVGVYGVFRPKAFPGGANLHPVNTTEIYYMLKGTATLVTGGALREPTQAPSPSTSMRGRASRVGSADASDRVTSSSSRDIRPTGSARSRPTSSI